MPHTDALTPTLPQGVDFFEELGRLAGPEVAGTAEPTKAPAFGEQVPAAVPRVARPEAPVRPEAAAAPGAPAAEPSERADVRGQISTLLSSGRIIDLVEAQRMLGTLVDREIGQARRDVGAPPVPAPTVAGPPTPPSLAAPEAVPSEAPLPGAPQPAAAGQRPAQPRELEAPTPAAQPAGTARQAEQGPVSAASSTVINDLAKLVREINKPGPSEGAPIPGRPLQGA